uniref:uncharacterized protein LOC120336336 n=1 Tax=Styela clava TaxID=7725 RepID=UPI001939D19B|nr:uncharacterized protein LOC120336336 [Styela clava]
MMNQRRKLTMIFLVYAFGLPFSTVQGSCSECPPLSSCINDVCKCRKNFVWKNPLRKLECVYRRKPKPRSFGDGLSPSKTTTPRMISMTTSGEKSFAMTKVNTTPGNTTFISASTKSHSTTNHNKSKTFGFCIPPSPMCIGIILLILIAVAILVVIGVICYCKKKMKSTFQALP